MLVIGGIYKGRKLYASHKYNSQLRPTRQSVKKAIFSTIANRINITSAKVLDCYAGTGSMGIEAISRGASQCDFIECNPLSANDIQMNNINLGINTKYYNIYRCDFMLYNTDEKYKIIISDPPYTDDHHVYNDIIKKMHSMLDENGIIAMECSRHLNIQIEYNHWRKIYQRAQIIYIESNT